jgi:hypothetical protein
MGSKVKMRTAVVSAPFDRLLDLLSTISSSTKMAVRGCEEASDPNDELQLEDDDEAEKFVTLHTTEADSIDEFRSTLIVRVPFDEQGRRRKNNLSIRN